MSVSHKRNTKQKIKREIISSSKLIENLVHIKQVKIMGLKVANEKM